MCRLCSCLSLGRRLIQKRRQFIKLRKIITFGTYAAGTLQLNVKSLRSEKPLQVMVLIVWNLSRTGFSGLINRLS